MMANRRLDADELIRHDAFLHEIATTWRPAGTRDRLLHVQAKVVHACTRLFGGGPTLVQIAVASMLIALGTALRVIAPAPHTASYAGTAPNWARAVVVACMLTLAFEAFQSPRQIRRRRWIALAIVPIPLLQFWLWVTSPFPGWTNMSARIGWALAGVGIALLICAAHYCNREVLRAALAVAMVGAGALACSEAARSIVFVIDDDPLLAAASIVTLFGCSLIAASLLRVRVELAA